MQTTLRLLIVFFSALLLSLPIFAKADAKDTTSKASNPKFKKSTLYPAFEFGYINQKVDSETRANKTGFSPAVGLGFRRQSGSNLFTSALLFNFYHLEGQRAQVEEVNNFASTFYLGYHRRFKVKKSVLEDGLNLRTRFGQGAAYTFKGRNNMEAVVAIGPEFKYATLLNKKEVRYCLGGYYDLGVVGQQVYTILFRFEGYYDFMSWFK